MNDVTTKKGPRSSKNERSSMTTALSAYTSGRGISVIERMADTVAAPSIESRVRIVISSNVVDTYEGQTETRTIWSDTTNKDFVARAMSRPSSTKLGGEDVTALVAVANFLVNRQLAVVLNEMIKIPMFMPRDTLFTKSDFYRALTAATNDITVAQVVMELVLPTLIQLGMINRNETITTQDYYPFKRVEVTDLTTEIAVIQAFSALDSIRVGSIDSGQRQSRTVFAERIAELFRPVGLALAQVPELSLVLGDIVKCVRANLTPNGSVGSEAVDVSTFWASHPLIAELAQCLPFARAALALPTASQVRLTNDTQTLEAWLKLVVQMLRDTPRYRWVSKNEALRHYGLQKVRTITGEPLSLIAYRAVQTESVGQTVIAVEDVLFGSGATFITATRDRIADVIKSAYGSATFSTMSSVDMIALVINSLTELGYTGWQGGLLVDAWGNGLTLSDIAVLSSDEVFVEFADNLEVIVNSASGQFDPVWWFKVATTERQLKVLSGRHLGTEVLTCDPIEALLASGERVASDVMPSRKQQLGVNAFNTTITSFTPSKMLQPMTTRMKFRMEVGGQVTTGALRAQDFATLRTMHLTSVVRPHFNEHVIMASEEAFMMALQLVQVAANSDSSEWNESVRADETTLRLLTNQCVVKLLRLAQQLSPSFRSEVQSVITERVLASENAAGEKAQMLRAKLIQPMYAARCDLIALQFFLHIQGVPAEGFTELMSSDEMGSVCALYGTDREVRM